MQCRPCGLQCLKYSLFSTLHRHIHLYLDHSLLNHELQSHMGCCEQFGNSKSYSGQQLIQNQACNKFEVFLAALAHATWRDFTAAFCTKHCAYVCPHHAVLKTDWSRSAQIWDCYIHGLQCLLVHMICYVFIEIVGTGNYNYRKKYLLFPDNHFLACKGHSSISLDYIVL